MVKRTVVGAHYGLMDWLIQRISAAIMACLFLLFVILLFFSPPSGFETWKALFSHAWIRIGALLFLSSLFLHAWVGMRDILMDYVHPTWIRLMLQVAVLLSLAACAIWSVGILWGN